MPTHKPVTVDCPVEFAETANRFGDFANAIRVTPEGGQECFLDFLVYSSQENRAQIVARVRIHRSFLKAIHTRLDRELALEIVRQGDLDGDVSRTLDGKIVFLKPPHGDLN